MLDQIGEQGGSDKGGEQAVMTLHLPDRDMTATMGVAAAAQLSTTELWIASSQNTSAVVELPCSAVRGQY